MSLIHDEAKIQMHSAESGSAAPPEDVLLIFNHQFINYIKLNK